MTNPLNQSPYLTVLNHQRYQNIPIHKKMHGLQSPHMKRMICQVKIQWNWHHFEYKMPEFQMNMNVYLTPRCRTGTNTNNNNSVTPMAAPLPVSHFDKTTQPAKSPHTMDSNITTSATETNDLNACYSKMKQSCIRKFMMLHNEVNEKFHTCKDRSTHRNERSLSVPSTWKNEWITMCSRHYKWAW